MLKLVCALSYTASCKERKRGNICIRGTCRTSSVTLPTGLKKLTSIQSLT
jgi:hypothetical protein